MSQSVIFGGLGIYPDDKTAAAHAEAESAALTVSLQEPQRVILEIRRGGRIWEIDVRIDADEDGGIVAEIGRDSVLCTSCEFGWNDRHDNEPQD